MINDKGYAIIKKDKENNTLSHAYMLLCKDDNPEEYLKNYAKLILCSSGGCNNCRTCRLIDKNVLPDVKAVFKSSILVDDINRFVEDTNVKPLEGDKKLYLISDFSGANVNSQNKLLKVLEEPPLGVYFLLACTNEYKVLDTIKSRVKLLENPPIEENILYNQLIGEFSDKNALKSAIEISGGYYYKTINAYSNATGLKLFVLEILKNYKKSSQLAEYANKINKDNIAGVISLLKVFFGQMLAYQQGDNSIGQEISVLAKEYKVGAILEIEEMLDLAEKKLFFNANISMLTDLVLFSLLEVKYKWQKL